MKALSLVAAIIFTLSISAQEVTGRWKTIDDETGKAKSVVEIYEKNGKIFGRVADLINPEVENPLCKECEGADYNKPIKGMTIIKNMEKDGDEYEDGTIFDPEVGKTYKCKLWLDEDDSDILNVRGYIAFLFRTQQWQRE